MAEIRKKKAHQMMWVEVGHIETITKEMEFIKIALGKI